MIHHIKKNVFIYEDVGKFSVKQVPVPKVEKSTDLLLRVDACSICGTGTSSGGIGIDGSYLQVGGIGAIVGDEAGGSWLARRAIRQTFDSMYRFGKKSLIDDIVMDELEVTDKYYLMEAIMQSCF
ncbi:MAG: hypothetical protein BHW12_01835 [Coprobacillus sp. 28_7]|nr:MAG: hypothetical protein BHW12_01835 [Coprobacillus sp. 28_7]